MPRTSRLVGLLVCALPLAYWGCGKNPPDNSCTAGQTQACTCADGTSGNQSCGSDGGFEACACTAPDGGNGTDAGHGTDAGMTTDAGNVTDSGNTTDGGNAQDSGTVTDAGSSDGGCGNGVLDPGEECDDGNLFDLDGCDSTCHYELLTRMTTFAISGSAAPAFCTPTTNALGTQVIASGTVLAELNAPLQADIDAGNINILTQFTGLTDLTGATDTNNLTLGIYDAELDPMKGTWPSNGGNPIDWWFLVNPADVSNGVSTNVLTGGQLTSHALTFGPSNVSLALTLGGSPATLNVVSARVSASVDTNPAPNTPAPPPTLLEAGLTVFQKVDGAAAGQGLCGNVTVASLAQIPIPAPLTSGAIACSSSCTKSHSYTACTSGVVDANCNSLLDAIVGGCGVNLGFCVPAINPTQPDVPGSGTVRALSLGANNKVPASQLTGDTDAYSSFFTFTQNRAHATGESCTLSTECQTGQTCQTGICK